MHFNIIARVFGILLLLFALTFLAPLSVSFLYGDGAHDAFLAAFTITLVSGALLTVVSRPEKMDLGPREGFFITAMYWFVVSFFGGLPFMLSSEPHLSMADAVFETVSGMTTTGATVIVGLDTLPESILFHRSWLHFLGGIGVVVMAVAILPMLGVGGMQMFKAETPGPMKDSKLTPRIANTAKALFTIYVTLNVACTIAYWGAGMSFFDAINHSFSTCSTGGFSTHDASMGYFNSPVILLICTFFMLMSAFNFALHFYGFKSGSVMNYWRDPEARFFLQVVGVVSLLTALVLAVNNTFSPGMSLVHSLFTVSSLITSTGFISTDFSIWPGALPLLMIQICFIGGCAGSTAGGMKVIRVLLALKAGAREIKRLIHPNGVFHVKLGGKVLPESVTGAVWGFLMFYVASFSVMVVLVAATGVDIVTAFSVVAACINNSGPALGAASSTFEPLNDAATWVCTFAMLLGRLEIFTLLVLFHPMFWRR